MTVGDNDHVKNEQAGGWGPHVLGIFPSTARVISTAFTEKAKQYRRHTRREQVNDGDKKSVEKHI